MTDDELRALVREAIARHMGGAAPARLGPSPTPGPLARAGQASSFGDPLHGQGFAVEPSPAGPGLVPAGTPPAAPAVVIANAPGGVAIAAGPGATVQVHISHAVFALPPARDGGHEGPCATEPDADCNSCGFCQSYGH